MNQRIKEVRKQAGLNQTEFGKRIGITQGAVAGYETGVRTPIDAIVSLICKEFGINKKWLLTGDGEMKSGTTREAEIAEITAKLYNAEEHPWLVPIVKALCDLDVSDWEKILDVAEQVIAARKEKAGE